MTFVVTESCIRCKYTDCVDVCPMDCFVEGPNFLVIDPDGCIDCSICVAECPVEAIVSDRDVPAGQQHFIALNAQLAKAAGWTTIKRSKAAPADHAAWAGVTDKLHLLERGD
jgi:ferredoxin